MSISTELFLAWRYLKPKRSAVSMISLLSVTGVTLGVAVLIVVIAVMTGFTDEMKEKILDTMAHIQIFDKYGHWIAKPDEAIALAEKGDCKASPVISKAALVQKGRSLFPKEVIGIDPEKMSETVPIGQFLISGYFSLEKGKIMIGDAAARELGLIPGDRLIMHSPEKIAKMVEYDADGKINFSSTKRIYLPSEYEVAGTFSMGKHDFDSSVIVMGIDDAADLFEMPWGSATSIFVRVQDPFHLDGELAFLRKGLSGNFRVYSWQEMNSQFLGVLAVEKNMMFFLLVFIVLVAAFSISNTLITVVLQKTREIGLIKALGGSSSMIMRVFVMQGLIVGLAGTFCGVLLGSSVIHWRNEILKAMRILTGLEIFPAKFYYFSQLPASLNAGDLITISAVSVLLCTVGAFVPAFRAAMLDPAKALRYE